MFSHSSIDERGKNCLTLQLSEFGFPDYILFQGFQNHLNGLWLISKEQVQYDLISYFASKSLKNFTRLTARSLLTGEIEVLVGNEECVTD